MEIANWDTEELECEGDVSIATQVCYDGREMPSS
jgi:hypothetical protein